MNKMPKTDAVAKPLELNSRVAELFEYMKSIDDQQLPQFHEAEATIRRLTADIEAAAVAMTLEKYDPKSEVVEYNGQKYRKMGPGEARTYHGMAAKFLSTGGMYRLVGVRNGPTIIPMELRAGITCGRMTPLAAKSIAYLNQALPYREAELTAKQLGVLPYSNSTFIRVAEKLEQLWEQQRAELEDTLMSCFEVPDEAVAMSVSVDRVSLPMEEPRERPVGRPKKNAPKRPIAVVYHMAYCSVITLYDAAGEPLRSIRCARMPGDGASQSLEETLLGDLGAIIESRPDLKLVTLADGAPEMQNILDRVTANQFVAARLIDFWHLIEKLAKAITATGRDPKEKLKAWKKRLQRTDRAIEGIEIELNTWALDYEAAEDADSEEVYLPDGLYDALTYIQNNRERLRYASTIKQGLPIGSGTVEATCKTIVSVRMKRPGARWKMTGGQAVMDLRSLATSSLWDEGMRALLGVYQHDVAEAEAA